jgi:hypothetical protein
MAGVPAMGQEQVAAFPDGLTERIGADFTTTQ